MYIVILSLFVPPIKQISIVVLLLRRIDRLLHQWLVYLADEPEAAIILLVLSSSMEVRIAVKVHSILEKHRSTSAIVIGSVANNRRRSDIFGNMLQWSVAESAVRGRFSDGCDCHLRRHSSYSDLIAPIMVRHV